MKALAPILLALLSACTTSSAIMLGKARPPQKVEDVKVFIRPPEKFESIALVTAFSNAAVSRDGSREKVIEELRRKAGVLGANGVILVLGERDTGPTTGTYIPGARKGAPGVFIGGGSTINVEMQAEAIFVQEQQDPIPDSE